MARVAAVHWKTEDGRLRCRTLASRALPVAKKEDEVTCRICRHHLGLPNVPLVFDGPPKIPTAFDVGVAVAALETRSAEVRVLAEKASAYPLSASADGLLTVATWLRHQFRLAPK